LSEVDFELINVPLASAVVTPIVRASSLDLETGGADGFLFVAATLSGMASLTR
jgi:hypothetical protein